MALCILIWKTLRSTYARIRTRKHDNRRISSCTLQKQIRVWNPKPIFQVAKAKKTNEQQFEFMLNSPLWVEGELRRWGCVRFVFFCSPDCTGRFCCVFTGKFECIGLFTFEVLLLRRGKVFRVADCQFCGFLWKRRLK